MYIGAATQNFTDSGSRPTLAAASRTVVIIHSAMSRSASCRMKPSPTSPASLSASGPYAATHTSRVDPVLHGKRKVAPLYSTGREFASSRMTWIDSRSVFRVVGAPSVTRTAESPRPMPQMVRLPYISFSVAYVDAVTVQSRVAGLVTIGPTMILRVSARIRL